MLEDIYQYYLINLTFFKLIIKKVSWKESLKKRRPLIKGETEKNIYTLYRKLQLNYLTNYLNQRGLINKKKLDFILNHLRRKAEKKDILFIPYLAIFAIFGFTITPSYQHLFTFSQNADEAVTVFAETIGLGFILFVIGQLIFPIINFIWNRIFFPQNAMNYEKLLSLVEEIYLNEI